MPDPSLTPARPEYYVQTGSMFDNPWGVPHDEIVQMVLELPAEVSAQVVFGKYVESSGLVFTSELIQMMFDRTGRHYHHNPPDAPMQRVTGDRWVHRPALEQAQKMTADQKKTIFATGIDWARITDYTVLFTLDLRQRPARVVAYRRLNRVPWETLYREAGRAAYMWGPSILCDATGMAGDVILDALDSRLYCPVHDRTIMQEVGYCVGRHGAPLGGCKQREMVPLSCVDGFEYSTSSKKGLIEHLRNVMATGYVSGTDLPFGSLRCPPVVQLEEELSFYAWDDKKLETDCLMALALAAWQGLEQVVGESYIGSVYGS